MLCSLLDKIQNPTFICFLLQNQDHMTMLQCPRSLRSLRIRSQWCYPVFVALFSEHCQVSFRIHNRESDLYISNIIAFSHKNVVGYRIGSMEELIKIWRLVVHLTLNSMSQLNFIRQIIVERNWPSKNFKLRNERYMTAAIFIFGNCVLLESTV